MKTASNDDTIAAYDQGVEKYVNSIKPEVVSDVKTWIDTSLQLIDTSAQIFEIGSGTGRDAAYIEDKGYNVQRSDASKAFVDLMTRDGIVNAKKIDILHDDIPTKNDLVLANAVLLHFTATEFRQILEKVHDSLGPQGVFAFTLKVGDSEETTSSKLDAPRFFKYWTKKSVENELELADFSIIKLLIGDDWRENKPQWLFIIARKGNEA